MKNNASYFFAFFFLLQSFSPALAGSLNPPAGTPASTMKTLEVIEPGTPVTAEDIPLTITSSGMYYFTDNIVCGTADANAIDVQAENVTIDMRGFSLVGPGPSAGTSGHGIHSGSDNVRVLDGSILNFRQRGVCLGDSSQAVGLVCNSNGQGGIQVGDYGLVRDCICKANAGSGEVKGIEATDNSRVENCTASSNTAGTGASAYGIYVQSGCVIKGNVASGNKGDDIGGATIGAGIYTEDNCAVESNVCNHNQGKNQSESDRANGSFGIRVGNGARVVENVCNGNGNLRQFLSIGILAGDHCHIGGNQIAENGSPFNGSYSTYGICCGSGNDIVGNHSAANVSSSNGSGWSVGILAGGSKNLIEKNHLHGGVDSLTEVGIMVEGDRNLVVSNRIHDIPDPGGYSIYFGMDADCNHYAGNFTQGGYYTGGDENIGGDYPHPNVPYSCSK